MHITLICADDEVWASGLRSISSTLCEAGHQTTMIFAGSSEVRINESVIKEIATVAGDSEIIGISSMSRGSGRAKMLIEGLRPLGKLIVWGGMYPTLFPEDCVGNADIVCRGEGEEFMLDLVERVASGITFKDIPNGAYLSDGRIILNDLRPLIVNLDNLPLLDYAFEKEYLLDPTGTLVPNTKMRDVRTILFSGSRGCYNKCTYCSNSKLKSIYGEKKGFARKMSISQFVKVAGKYRVLFPRAVRFYFTDEDFFARPVDEMREFAYTYPSKGGLPFECMAYPGQITEEKLVHASKAGMAQIDIGLESMSQNIRFDVFNRFIDDETLKRVAIMINKHACKALYFLIIGNPYEERQDLIDGICMWEKMPPPFHIRTYSLVFIPGTELFERASQDKLIKGINESGYDTSFLTFDHRKHDWKRKNLYLNSLIYLMHGKSTMWRMGYVPKGLIPFLISSRTVDFCDRHPRIGEIITSFVNLVRKFNNALKHAFARAQS